MYLPKVQRDIFFATGAASAAKQIHQKTRILHLRPNNFITNFYDGSETKRNLPAVFVSCSPFFPTCHPWQIRSQEKLTNIKNDVNFLKMPTCLQINSPVAVQILGEARFEGETMRRESAKIREKKKKQRRERENENFNPRKTPNTQAFLSCAQLSLAELRPRFLPLSPEHRFISLNLPLFGHQLCNNAKGVGRRLRVPGKKYRKNKIKINLRMAHKISLASYFQIIFFLFCATSSVTCAAPVPPAPSRGLATQSSHHPLL